MSNSRIAIGDASYLRSSSSRLHVYNFLLLHEEMADTPQNDALKHFDDF